MNKNYITSIHPITAVDFDGTLCENKWPEIGEPNLRLIQDLIDRQKNGGRIILWTCRTEKELMDAVLWCAKYGLIFDAVNDNLPDVKAAFSGESRKVLAHEYIDDRSINLYSLPFVSSVTNPQLEWARKETDMVLLGCEFIEKITEDNNTLPMADKKEINDYVETYMSDCHKIALKIYEQLFMDSVSAPRLDVIKSILNKLLDHKPLTPIYGVDEDWVYGWASEIDGEREYHYQCNRMPALFKKIVVKDLSTMVTYRDISRYICKNVDDNGSTYNSPVVEKVIDEIFPITMPYMPEQPLTVYCDGFLYGDEKPFNFQEALEDTFGIMYGVNQYGEKIELNRFFKIDKDGNWVPITKKEFDLRKTNKHNSKNNKEK